MGLKFRLFLRRNGIFLLVSGLFLSGARMLVCPTNFDLQFVMSAKEAHIVQSATISVSEERQACK